MIVLPLTTQRPGCRRRVASRAQGFADGFTLIELLVATTVTLLLVVVLVRVFNGASGTWRRSEAQVDAYREARGAMQLMARDLSATLQASYAQAGGGADPANYSPAMPTLVLRHYPDGPHDDTVAAGGPTNEEVYCLTNISNRGASSLCAVGYFCQWMADPKMFPVNGTLDQRPQAYALMRQSLDSDGTFKRIQAAATHSPLTFADLYKRNLSYTPSTDSLPLAVATPIASYVWDLRFRIDTDLDEVSVADGNATTAATDHSSPTLRHYGGDASDQPYPPRLPPYVEIRFKALSELAGRRLEGTNSGVNQATWKSATSNSLIRSSYQQFVLRVPLLNATPLPTPGPPPGA